MHVGRPDCAERAPQESPGRTAAPDVDQDSLGIFGTVPTGDHTFRWSARVMSDNVCAIAEIE